MTLTREEILSRSPGREMDRWIQEHVFKVDLSGFHWARVGNSMFKNTDGAVTWVDIPDYSSDISAAWEVADKLKISIIPQSLSAPDNLKYLARAEWDFRQNEIDVFAATAPEAISKVALLMVLKL
ncbi:hypothetical protein P40081_15170 [Paenibacillus sp. FSL P4-0081]|uniref:BC1872 family protein n=1 Tax=Paenibacillus sp. FSL P4-0081 TaxID=1536769 RepID=UPI0004F5A292|nr:hypothetical protein [Paenibacillus sp. FSL P4-0081]AIQ29341.1 hypothetical protein P40081_15170 [Paenibacillus sp. FSL P4-0081]